MVCRGAKGRPLALQNSCFPTRPMPCFLSAARGGMDSRVRGGRAFRCAAARVPQPAESRRATHRIIAQQLSFFRGSKVPRRRRVGRPPASPNLAQDRSVSISAKCLPDMEKPTTMKPNKRGNEEYGSFAGEICLILDTVYRSSRRRFQAEAKARGISLES